MGVEVEGPFAQDAAQREAFVSRVVGSMLGTMDATAMYLGERLGLYRALAGAPATSAELAGRVSADERYVREWLEQQAGSGILEVDGTGVATERRYRLPAAHAEVLIEGDSPYYLGSYPRLLMSCVSALPELLDVFPQRRRGAL